MTSRTDKAVAMLEHERLSALVYIGNHHPEIFDEAMGDIEHQRRIRAKREMRQDGTDEGSGDA